MKLYNIAEDETTDQPSASPAAPQQLTDDQIQKLKQMQEDMDKVHRLAISKIDNTGLGQIVADSKELYRVCLKIASSDFSSGTSQPWDPLETPQGKAALVALQKALLLKPEVIKTFDETYPHAGVGLEKSWKRTCDRTVLASIKNTQENYSSLGGRLEEGIISSFVDMFEKLGAWFVRNITAGLAIAGPIAAKILEIGTGATAGSGGSNRSSRNRNGRRGRSSTQSSQATTTPSTQSQSQASSQTTTTPAATKAPAPAPAPATKKPAPATPPAAPPGAPPAAQPSPTPAAPPAAPPTAPKPLKFNVYNAQFIGEILDTLTEHNDFVRGGVNQAGFAVGAFGQKPADLIYEMYQDAINQA